MKSSGKLQQQKSMGKFGLWGVDVAKALGYATPRNAVPKFVSDEDKLSTQIEYAGQKRSVTVINESGLYSLILSSKLESAKEFKHWVTSEVLPSIRKTGSYSSYSNKEEMEAVKMQCKVQAANILYSLSTKYEKKGYTTYSQILDAYASKEIAGEFLLPLPATEKTYTATEIGSMLGISAKAVGTIANQKNIKTKENGMYVLDKAKGTNKEVQTFRYNEKGFKEIKNAYLNNIGADK